MLPGRILRSHNGKFRMIMQHGGNLVLYNDADWPLWASGTHGHEGAYAMLRHTQRLWVYSSSSTVLWSSPIVRRKGESPVYCVMQDDGNFVLYDSRNRPLFATATEGNRPGSHGFVQRL